jgi:excisionase family DNA binding protein
MPNDDPTLTAEDVASRLGVKSSTIKAWLRNGTLTGVRLTNKVIRFRPSDVRRLVERHETQAALEGRLPISPAS